MFPDCKLGGICVATIVLIVLKQTVVLNCLFRGWWGLNRETPLAKWPPLLCTGVDRWDVTRGCYGVGSE